MKHSDEKIQQLIESYLNQEMNDLDRSRFEKMIHDDPELHDEVEFQQATIEAIKKERMLALKAGLSQVPVSLWSLGLIEAAKIAAITAGIGLASVGSYFGYQYFNQPSENSIVSTPVTTESNQEASASEAAPSHSDNSSGITNQAEEKENLEPKPTQGFETKPEHALAPGQKNQAKNNNKPSREQNSIDYASGLKNTGEQEVKEPTAKNLQLPNTQDINLPQDGITSKTSLESIHPEVVFKRNNKDNFHYQFSDSKLVLYADFNDKLYEVLELNQTGSKKLFLAYNGKFFGLDPSQTNITPLEEVKDAGLNQILAEYQKRRN